MSDRRARRPGGPSARPEGGLSALAAVLGPMQPDDPKVELLLSHVERLDVLCAAAPVLAVGSASYAALAVSVIAEATGRVRDGVVSDEDLEGVMLRIQAVAARIGSWLIEQHGARPLAVVWTSDATPYPDLYPQPPHRPGAA